MISVSAYRYLRILLELVIFAALTLAALALFSSAGAQTRTPRAAPPPKAQEPLPVAQVEELSLREYRGVQLGMTPEQVREKLGTPSETNERQDFFVLSPAESAQVFYDTQKRVMAVSANYLGEAGGAPGPEKVFGTPVALAEDGSLYKMVRYERAGYMVIYSRSAGDAPPLVTVTMQKIVN